MIVNIKNKEDLITLDFRIKQLRYLKDYKNKGELIFKDFNQATNDSLIYLLQICINVYLQIHILHLNKNI